MLTHVHMPFISFCLFVLFWTTPLVFRLFLALMSGIMPSETQAVDQTRHGNM